MENDAIWGRVAGSETVYVGTECMYVCMYLINTSLELNFHSTISVGEHRECIEEEVRQGGRRESGFEV